MKMLPFFHPEKISVRNCSNYWLRGGQQHLRDFRFPSVPWSQRESRADGGGQWLESLAQFPSNGRLHDIQAPRGATEDRSSCPQKEKSPQEHFRRWRSHYQMILVSGNQLVKIPLGSSKKPRKGSSVGFGWDLAKIPLIKQRQHRKERSIPKKERNQVRTYIWAIYRDFSRSRSLRYLSPYFRQETPWS